MTNTTGQPGSLRYVATMATPGYLPWSDDAPPSFVSSSDAWHYLADERRWQEDAATAIDETGPDELAYSDTVTELDELASATGADVDGTVYGATPGYDGNHDLGVAYTVHALSHTRQCLAHALICAVENIARPRARHVRRAISGRGLSRHCLRVPGRRYDRVPLRRRELTVRVAHGLDDERSESIRARVRLCLPGWQSREDIMPNPHRAASARALATMRATVQELADRRGVPVREIYDELGAYDATPWGRRMRVLTAPLVAAMTNGARRELDTLNTTSKPADD